MLAAAREPGREQTPGLKEAGSRTGCQSSARRRPAGLAGCSREANVTAGKRWRAPQDQPGRPGLSGQTRSAKVPRLRNRRADDAARAGSCRVAQDRALARAEHGASPLGGE